MSTNNLYFKVRMKKCQVFFLPRCRMWSFEEYYEGLSIQVDNDEDFMSILRNTWTI